MRKARFGVAALLTFVGIAAFAQARAEPGPEAVSSEALDRLRAAMHRLVDDHKRAGIAYGVMIRGKLVALDAYGMADIGHNRPMTPETIHRLFSMTRAITTVGFLTLVEQGRIGIDDPVSRYIPAFADTPVLRSATGDPAGTEPQARPMTIRMLLNYTSGLGYPFEYPSALQVPQTRLMGQTVTTAEGIERIAKLPLFAQPGARWRYGFSGDVLGRIIEVVSGQTLDVFLKSRLFDPIGMHDTRFWYGPDRTSRLARAYGPVGANPLGDVNTTWQGEYGTFDKPIPFLSGGGGLASTTTDYLRFVQMLVNGGTIDGLRILRPETVRDMLSPHAILQPGLGFHPETAFGYGIGVSMDTAARPYDLGGHEAGWAGLADTHFFLDTEHQIAAVAMTQYFGPDNEVFFQAFRQGVYGLIAK